MNSILNLTIDYMRKGSFNIFLVYYFSLIVFRSL